MSAGRWSQKRLTKKMIVILHYPLFPPAHFVLFLCPRDILNVKFSLSQCPEINPDDLNAGRLKNEAAEKDVCCHQE